jgi:hypothetical protein
VIKGIKNLLSAKKTAINDFNTAVSIIKEHSRSIDDAGERLCFLEYTLYAVRSDLVSSYRAKLFYKRFVNNQISFMPSIHDSGCQKKEIALESAHVFSVPWKIESISELSVVLRDRPFKQDDLNHLAIYYPYMDICYVHNGIHSATMGKYYCKGVIHADIYNIEKAFECYYTDGCSWYGTETGERKGNVFDYRIAVLFEIARMIYEHRESAKISDPNHIH